MALGIRPLSPFFFGGGRIQKTGRRLNRTGEKKIFREEASQIGRGAAKERNWWSRGRDSSLRSE
jgi:hypothetical protein